MRDESVVEEIDAIRTRIDSHRPFTPDVAKRIERWFVPRFIYCSNALGASDALTGAETAAFLEREIVSGGHPLDRFLAVGRHQSALELVQERARSLGGAIDVPFVQEVHRRLTQGARGQAEQRPGMWKENESPPTRRRGHLFRYAAPDEVERYMQRLVAEFGERRRNAHPLEAVTWCYYHLHLVHPFEKSNGKVARLIATCALLNHGYPPLIIPSGEVGDYLDALSAVDITVPADEHRPLSPKFDLSPLIEFFCKCLERTGQRMLDLLTGQRPGAGDFARAVGESQDRMLTQFLSRKNISWRVRASQELRSLHHRVEGLARQLEVKGSLYSLTLGRSDVVATHNAAKVLGPALPAGDAGLVGEVQFVLQGDPTMKGLRFPDTVRLVVGLAAASYGIQLILAWDDGREPEVHHGPSRSPEWPSSTLEELLTRALDARRKTFEKELKALNASISQRYRILREQLREESGRQRTVSDTTPPSPTPRGTPRPKDKEPGGSGARRRSETSLEGVRPAEPPLNF